MTCDDPTILSEFIRKRASQIAKDKDGHPVFLTETKWSLEREIKEQSDILFHFTSEKII